MHIKKVIEQEESRLMQEVKKMEKEMEDLKERMNVCEVTRNIYVSGSIFFLRTSDDGIPALRKLPCGVRSRYTGGTVCQRQASDAGIPALFSTADWHWHARVIEIQTRQQLKNNCSHETQ